jgi:hypothetical protein
MARAEEFWIKFQDSFDPGEILVGERSKEFYCERDDSPIEEILQELRPSIQQTVAFVTGHRGSGKSSTLLRLLDRLKTDFFIVYFDIEHNIDVARVHLVDLLFLLGTAIHKVAYDEGYIPDSRLLSALIKSINEATQSGDHSRLDLDQVVCFGQSHLGAGLGVKLAELGRRPPQLSSWVTEDTARTREFESLAPEIVNHVSLIIEVVSEQADKQVLVIIDGLDKLQDQSQTEEFFFKTNILRVPFCRLIYVVPLYIFKDHRFGQLAAYSRSFPFPNIKLYEKNDCEQTDVQGYRYMREVVRKRLKGLGVGLDELFDSWSLDKLIFKSGGIMRWFITLVRDAGKYAERMKLEMIDDHAAERAISDFEVRNSSRLLDNERLLELSIVHRTHFPTGNEISNQLLHALLIVAYPDRGAGTWFDAHPITWEALEAWQKSIRNTE